MKPRSALLIGYYAVLPVLLCPDLSTAKVYSSEAEGLFRRGLEAYSGARFERAHELMTELLDFPMNQRSSAAHFILSRSSFRLGHFEQALVEAKQFRRRYSVSRYLPDVRLVAGDSYYVLKRYYEAATQYSHILAAPAHLELQAIAAERLAAIVKNGFITPTALQRIRMSLGAERLEDALRYGEAHWYSRVGWEEESQAALQDYVAEVPRGMFMAMATASLAIQERGDGEAILGAAQATEFEESEPPDELGADGRPRLGLLLPLSGPFRKYGEDLLNGIRLANSEAGERFELVTRDTGFEYQDLPIVESKGNELLRTVEATRGLIEEDSVTAIVGPVFSGSAVVAAVAANSAGVPLIAPLAQQSGLDDIGDFIFQLNVIPDFQGRSLGEVATLALGLRNLAIVAPLTDYGWNFVREFSDSAHANGGDVVYTGWYVPGETTDFKIIFEEMRQVGFSLMPPPPPKDTLAVLDSLAWLAGEILLDLEGQEGELSEDLATLEDAADRKEEIEEAPPDSAEIFIDNIDGVVIVVESFADANTIAPQLRFHRIETQILGNDLWYEPDAIRRMPRREQEYVKGTVFVSRYYEGGGEMREFTDSYRRSFQRDPGFAAYGYDSLNLLASGWDQGHRSSAELRDWLALMRDFEGASGLISFAVGRRANTELTLLKIVQRGRVRPMGSSDLPDMSAAVEESEWMDLPAAEFDLLEEGLDAEESED